ncbi:MAG: response regulator [Spirochaetota bacterium]|nr:response regulator [Spirochaetota bacterium]
MENYSENIETEVIDDKSKSHILVVDDEQAIRKTLTRYLQRLGHNVDDAEDGLVALNKLENNSFDLVLTDINMPNMDGRELLKVMSIKFPEMPKIVLTGLDDNEDLLLALKSGAYDFLNKPLANLSVLQRVIDRALEKKRLNDEKNKYVDQVKHINEIISMLNQGKNTEEIFRTLNITLKKIIPFNRLALTIIDDDMIVTKIVESDRNIYLDKGDKILLKKSSLYEAFTKKEVLIVDDLHDYQSRNPESRNTKLLIKEGMRSSLALPLIINDVVRGFLLFASIKPNFFLREHIIFLESIVGQISFSIQRGELSAELEMYTQKLEILVKARADEILKTQKTTIFALSKLAEVRDPETGEHLERIRRYSVLIAQIYKYTSNNFEITNQYLRDIYDSSILHDIGKVGIHDSILLKEGPLTPEEFNIMRSHTTIGYNALRSSSKDLGENSFLDMAMEVVHCHHERWDGTGYPKGLKSKEIPLSARIVAISDVYDALTSRRPYKEALSHEEAIKIMKEENNHFDPELFKIFCDNSEEFNRIRKEFRADCEK